MESVKPTRTLGVTGGIGSGKSAVTNILSKLGARIFSADLVARQIMIDDANVRSEIKEAFGKDSYLPDGSLNRGYLASLIFADEQRVAQMNSIVHPRVFQAFKKMKEEANRDAVPVLVHEAALVFESGGYKHLDAVLVVHTPVELRIQRVMDRDNATREQVLSRMSHQLPPEELLERADYVIHNDDSLEVLTERATAFYQQFLAEG